MKKEKKIRMSNIEILRIIAMILIVINHIFYNVIMVQLSAEGNLYLPGELFNNFAFYKRLTLTELSLTFGKIGNTLFMLITGYFLINKNKINLAKQAKKLLSQIVFIISILVLASSIYSLFDNNFMGLIQITSINNCGWFAGYYLLVIIIAQLFGNKYLNKLNKKQYLSLIIVGFVLIQIGWSRDALNEIVSSVVINGFLFYIIGGYIKKFNPLKKVKSIILILIPLLIFTLIIISYKNMVLLSINKALESHAAVYYQTFEKYNDWAFVTIIIAICIFELFSRIKIKNNKIINYIGSTTFIVFILHDNIFTYEILKNFDWIAPYYNNILLFLEMLLLAIIIIFTMSAILYKILSLLISLTKTKSFSNIINKKKDC